MPEGDHHDAFCAWSGGSKAKRICQNILMVSMGITELSAADEDASGWLRQADSALYRAKQGGQNRLVEGLSA